MSKLILRAEGSLNFMTIREYILSLKDGERMIETSMSCLYGRCGTVYHSDDGCTCIMWDKIRGEDGHMGTSVTGGARRVSEVLNGISIEIVSLVLK